MKTAVVLLLLLHGAAPVYHSLHYIATASSGFPNLPEYLAVGQINGVEVVRYDSNTRRVEAKQDWLERATAGQPQAFQTLTERSLLAQLRFNSFIEEAKQRLNLTGGAHIFQWMVGCEWDDETGETDAFHQFAFDGEDYMSFDLKTLTWIATKPQALPTKHRWDNDKVWLEYTKELLNQYCLNSLKTTLVHGKSSLLRTERPSMWFLQRTPSSPLSCFATGFFPDRALIFWRKDGEELHEGVDMGELLPNHDGTFQISADLTLPVDAKDLHKYECVFQLSGLKEELVYRLDAHPIKTNHNNPSDANVIVVVAVIVLALVVLASIAFVLYKKKKKKNAQCLPPASDSGSELSQRLEPVS